MNLTSQTARLHTLVLTDEEAGSLAVFLGDEKRSRGLPDLALKGIYELLRTRNDDEDW